MSRIATVEQLEQIYGETGDASIVKVADRVTPSYRVMIEKSPFAVNFWRSLSGIADFRQRAGISARSWSAAGLCRFASLYLR